MHLGLPLHFQAVSQLGGGVTPLTLPGSADLQSWHDASLGLKLNAQLIGSGVTPPGVTFDADVDQSLAFRMDCTGSGARGVATYGLTLDGGLSYFQTGTTAFNVAVPLLGRTLVMNTGIYTILDQWITPCKQMANQTPKTRTLFGNGTDTNKPRIIPTNINGYPSLLGVGGTSSAMTDTTSAWAADVASGNARTWSAFLVVKAPSAAPSSVNAFFSFGDNTDADPAFLLGVRNGTNLWRTNRINDAGTSSTRDAGALDTNWNQFTWQQDGNNTTLRKNGSVLINNLSLGSGQTTLSSVALFALMRAGAVTNVMAGNFTQMMTYSSAFMTGSTMLAIENWQRGRYAL